MTPTLKKALTYGGIGVIVIVTAFSFGRYTKPDKVVEKERVVTVEKQVVVEKIDEKAMAELSLQVKSALTQLTQLKKSIHKEKRTTTLPDGRMETTETEDINVDRTVKTTDVKEVEKQVVVVQEKVVDRVVEVEKRVEVEKEKIVEAMKPQWRVGAMVGINARDIGQALTTGALTFGAHVDRRIVGPVSVGAWGLSSGHVGLGVNWEF